MAVAVRLAHKMNLHNERPPFKVSFFEKEMRIRLWWQIRCHSTRFLQSGSESIPPVQDMGNVRMPLNLNDSELHPDMVDCPVEHVGATEMTYCLLKYEGARWRSMARPTKKSPSANTPSNESLMLNNEAIRDMERTFEEKYLRFCDARIPLHFLSLTLSHLAICRMRFMAYHPRGRADGGACVTPEEREVMFEQSVRVLELQNQSRKTSFSSQLLTHMARSHFDSLIYTLYELRERPKGDRVTTAWNQIALFYEQYRELIDEKENSFLDALADLTLEAWQMRWKELVETQGRRVDDVTPWYIKELQARRPKESSRISSAPADAIAEGTTGENSGTTAKLQSMVDSTGQLGWEMEGEPPFLGMHGNFGDDNSYDMDYWSEFLQM
jgi:hypothetical protein